MYCSQLWRPRHIQDILLLERVQRRSTLNDYTSDYCTRLIKLSLLPLMYVYELNDLIFFIKSLKQPSHSFDITKWVKFNSSITRSSTHLKLELSAIYLAIFTSTDFHDCGILFHLWTCHCLLMLWELNFSTYSGHFLMITFEKPWCLHVCLSLLQM